MSISYADLPPRVTTILSSARTTTMDQRSTLTPDSKDEVDFVAVATNNNYNNNNNYNINISNKINDNNIISNKLATNKSSSECVPSPPINNNGNQQQSKPVPNNRDSHSTAKSKKKSGEAGVEPKKSTTAKERLSLFSFSKKSSQKSNPSANNDKDKPVEPEATAAQKELEKYKPLTLPCDIPPVPIGTPPRQNKFVKSNSISRLFANTYNAKKFEKEEQKRLASDTKFNTFGGRRRASGPYLERFKRYAKDDGDVAPQDAAAAATMQDDASVTLTAQPRDRHSGSRSECMGIEQLERNEDLGAKAMRTLSRGLGKLWWKRTHSVDISTPDPEFKVSYLGNVLTGWAKGEGCVEKQLNTLWRNYTQNNKPDVIMRLKVCASGLKATTRQHGLTEYWANRITHCCAPKNYPRVFCWIYRHEGRKLKHELRCHAVLCSKEKIVQDICNTLKENLERALRDFKREKILKQNARLSLANAAYDNPSLPRRKILLSVGGNNYRPPLERSKSAPKLMAIEEAIGEEDGDEVEETNEPEMKPCCQKDSLYPAMTLGRRRCRRGHSIRRTGKTRPVYSVSFDESAHHMHVADCCNATRNTKEIQTTSALAGNRETVAQEHDESRHSYGSDDSDDFEKLLKYNNYDSNASLANELLPYFDMQLHKNTSSSLGDLTELKDDEEPMSLLPTINSDPSADPEADYNPSVDHDAEDEPVVGLRRNGVCSDGEEDYLDAEDMYFRQASILNMLHRNSMRKMANLSLSSDESSIETNASAPLQYRHQIQSSISSNASSTTTSGSALDAAADGGANGQRKLNPDSDEGSISSGCETASTVTANQDDVSLKYRQSKPSVWEQTLSASEHGILDEEPVTAEEIYQRLESRLQRRQNSDATTFSSSSSITLKMGGSSPTTSLNGLDGSTGGNSTANGGARNRRTWRLSTQREQRAAGDDSDSECSDESGYVEFQERDKSAKEKAGAQIADKQPPLKPQPPPKPMPRRLLNTNTNTSNSTAV